MAWEKTTMLLLLLRFSSQMERHPHRKESAEVVPLVRMPPGRRTGSEPELSGGIIYPI